MKKKLFQTAWMAGCAAGLSLCCGCLSGNAAKKSDADVQVQQTVPVVTTSAPAASDITLVNQNRDLLRLEIQPGGASADEKSLAQKIGGLTINALSSSDAVIGRSGTQDLALTIRPELTTADQTGEYYLMNCCVNLELKSIASGRVFGGKQIKIVGKRTLGKEAAINQFDAVVAKDVAEWCRGELKRIAGKEMDVAVLNIQLSKAPKGKAHVAQKDAAEIQAIGTKLATLPNVVSYELVGNVDKSGICQYRVAYFKAAYPNGIANEVSVLLKSVVTK